MKIVSEVSAPSGHAGARALAPPGAMTGTPGDMEERVKQIMADVLDLEPLGIDGDTTMDTIERWDSLTHITLCLSLEQDFQVSFAVGEMEAMLSYDDILLVLSEKLR